MDLCAISPARASRLVAAVLSVISGWRSVLVLDPLFYKENYQHQYEWHSSHKIAELNSLYEDETEQSIKEGDV